MDERGGQRQRREYPAYCRRGEAAGGRTGGTAWGGRAGGAAWGGRLTDDGDNGQKTAQPVGRAAAALGISNIFPGEVDTTPGGRRRVGDADDGADDGRMTHDSDDRQVTPRAPAVGATDGAIGSGTSY